MICFHEALASGGFPGRRNRREAWPYLCRLEVGGRGYWGGCNGPGRCCGREAGKMKRAVPRDPEEDQIFALP